MYDPIATAPDSDTTSNESAFSKVVNRISSDVRRPMRKLTLVLRTLFILLFPFSTMAQTDFLSIDAFLKSTLKATDELSVQARGDLNEDGLEDWAGVINRRRADSSIHPRSNRLLPE